MGNLSSFFHAFIVTVVTSGLFIFLFTYKKTQKPLICLMHRGVDKVGQLEKKLLST